MALSAPTLLRGLVEGLLRLTLPAELATWLVFGVLWRLVVSACPKNSTICRYPVQTGLLIIQTVVLLLQLANGWGHLAVPSWGWLFPFGTPTYACTETWELAAAATKFCAEGEPNFCLSEADWTTLSSRALSRDNARDVAEVARGIAHARALSGLVIAGLARNTAQHIQAWRENAESFLPFFSSVSVVVFENDSTDGTREALKAWGAEVAGSYEVSIVECEDSPDCKLGHGRWYTAGPKGGRKQTQLAHYRNLLLQEVLRRTEGKGSFELLVMDVDLAVSISPLGVMHTLGVQPYAPVAVAGRFITAMTLGSMDNYYDLSAFRPSNESGSGVLVAMHDAFCRHALRIASGWDRAMCDTSSAFHIGTVLANHRGHEQIYRVESAYNGAVLYPLDQIRESGARYSTASTWGSAESGDGDLNEHILFHRALAEKTAPLAAAGAKWLPAMFLNPKWSFHVNPERPPGPTGPEWKKVAARVGANPFPFVELFLIAILIRWPIGAFFLRMFLVGRPRSGGKATAQSKKGEKKSGKSL